MTSVLSQPGPPPSFGGHGSIGSVNDQLEKQEASSPGVPRGDVKTKLNFFNPPSDGSVPYNYVEEPPAGKPQRNFDDATGEITVHDLRGQESSFSLDRHAFAALQGHPHNPAIDWNDDESVKKHYYPEVEKLLLTKIPGNPTRVLIFDHTIRRQEPNAKRAPVTRAHIDQTVKSAKMRVEFHLPEKEAEEVIAKDTRYRIINVWRPLNGAVESFPLSFANSETVPSGDVVGVEHRYPDRTGETAGVKYNPQHEWYYWSGMENDERLLLQCADSHNPGTRVPHSAFAHPGTTQASKPRQSIEVRALVFG